MEQFFAASWHGEAAAAGPKLASTVNFSPPECQDDDDLKGGNVPF